MAALSTFPVSVRVEGRRIVIVGGDEEALGKARLAARTSAEILVIAESLDADFSGLAVRIERRPVHASDFDNAALVFIARHDAEGGRARALAKAAGVLVNEIDVPAHCDFYTPAIIDRAPISVAVSSEGDSPVLARMVRARIEAALSPNLGRIAALAGAMRDKIAALLPDGVARRRFHEALATSPRIERAVLAGEGEAVAEALLTEHARAPAAAGVVWLIGAGPGSVDLLTLRAQRLLQEADVIVHDQLVPTEVVEMGRRDAERIPVGKAKGHHSFSQAQINTLIVRLAREGKRVARLKSGDPMVFGRAGEEIAALEKAGIAFAIVPGVTAALAAAADTATPVTLRKVSSGFVMATAHGADDAEIGHWTALAQSGLSLALYMGKSIAGEVATRFLAGGLPATTPVGIVVNAGRDDPARFAGTLGRLAEGKIAFPDGPAVIFIGEAVAHGNWTDATPLGRAAIRVA